MCGLAGFVGLPNAVSRDGMLTVIANMTEALAHRGPDSSGIWIDEDAGIALGHRRLAIVDLSADGHQPMVSADGRLVAIYNGEIFNFRDIRRDLQGLGHGFRGHSDTEVMLAAIETWGLEAALPRFAGMFALALWDRQQRTLHLVRDRLGKKPLYIALCRNTLLFASELKAFHAFPGFSPGIDRAALALYLRRRYVPDPYCIYEMVLKLPPASMLTLRPSDLLNGIGIEELRQRARPYWSALEVARRGQADPLALGEREVTDELDRILRMAVAERMIADVPLGAFLSGGIDSSVVVALMQAQSSRPVRTFTIGFEDKDYDEAVDARRVAAHLGTEHTELYLQAADAQAVVPSLPSICDEPLADPSQIPTYLVSRLAREHVTVALTGDGGDESFGGYARYRYSERLTPLFMIPRMARQAVGRVLTAMAANGWDAMLAACRPLLPAGIASSVSGRRIHRLADVLAFEDQLVMYRDLLSHWRDPPTLVRGGHEPATAFGAFDWGGRPLADITSCMMYLDTVSYLPGDILVKVDRASMAVGLEARCPLLDHRVVELAWRLPLELKVRGGKGKWLLRELLARHLPRSLFERPKRGFGVPLGDWLRGPLRGWAEELLDEARLRREGFLDPLPIRRAWAEHLEDVRSWTPQLWDVLVFQAWHDHWHGAGRTAMVVR
jgi:asparagine synthase (glutamine-hydrolysing)